MLRYIARRSLWMAVVLLIITFLIFIVFFVMPPTDPALSFAGKQPTPALLEEINRQFGLDRPLLIQYTKFLQRLVLGDEYGWPGLGFSYQSRSPIKEVLYERIGVTIQLAMGSAILWMAIGIPIGVISALKRRSRIDRFSMGFALFGVSAPVFWLGLLFLYIFYKSLGLRWLGTGYTPFTENPFAWFGHFLLPWTVIALLYAAIYARVVRGQMIEVMNEDYIRTARAKGLSERRVVLKHGLRSSLTPVVTLFGADVGSLLGGAVVTESVFNLPGLGPYLIGAVRRGDLPVVLAVTLVAAFAITFFTLVVDILYAYLDPRVRYA